MSQEDDIPCGNLYCEGHDETGACIIEMDDRDWEEYFDSLED